MPWLDEGQDCKTDLIWVEKGKHGFSPFQNDMEHVDEEVNHTTFHPELYVDLYMCIYYMMIFWMAGDGLFQKILPFYFFLISLIKISLILVDREKQNRSRGVFLLLSMKNCIKIIVDTSQRHQLPSSYLLGNYCMVVSGFRCPGRLAVAVHVSSQKIDVLGRAPSWGNVSGCWHVPLIGARPQQVGSSICVGFLVQFHDLHAIFYRSMGVSLEFCSPYCCFFIKKLVSNNTPHGHQENLLVLLVPCLPKL